MKKIKYLVITLVAMALMPSCSNQSEQEQTTREDSINTELSDSLATAMAEKDSLMALMNDINEGMNQLKELQDVVSVQNLNGETPDRKAQLRSDMELLQKSVAERKKRLDELEKRLRQSQNYNDEMRKTIQTMKQQLENQQATIDDLTNQLAQAHIVINTLNTRVDSLNTVNTEVREEKARAQEETTRVTNEMNVCYYAIGNKKELKQNNIIETGFLKKTKIMEGDFEKSYFTKADKRTLSVIPLHSKKAKLLSKHPKNTYQMVDDGNVKSLHITDPARFWELSNYLIVQVD
ncbi:MAG: hypothetical protein IJ613_07320 [Muribaculaceae bacterium]|nr:hypothetical protein [Muribaculaceae bacterium]MBR1475365.1 hypothetical protein [Muribaculaceae bacterium]